MISRTWRPAAGRRTTPARRHRAAKTPDRVPEESASWCSRRSWSGATDQPARHADRGPAGSEAVRAFHRQSRTTLADQSAAPLADHDLRPAYISEQRQTSSNAHRWRRGVLVASLVSINEVDLRWARLVLGWVTVSGFDSRRRHFISVCNQQPMSTQPSTLRGTVKWVPAKGRSKGRMVHTIRG